MMTDKVSAEEPSLAFVDGGPSSFFDEVAKSQPEASVGVTETREAHLKSPSNIGMTSVDDKIVSVESTILAASQATQESVDLSVSDAVKQPSTTPSASEENLAEPELSFAATSEPSFFDNITSTEPSAAEKESSKLNEQALSFATDQEPSFFDQIDSFKPGMFLIFNYELICIC